MPKPELYYIQDTRECVGNSALWWREGGHGYTCDLRQAWKVEREEWFGSRDTDVLRPVSEMDWIAEMHVDVQRIGPGAVRK